MKKVISTSMVLMVSLVALTCESSFAMGAKPPLPNQLAKMKAFDPNTVGVSDKANFKYYRPLGPLPDILIGVDTERESFDLIVYYQGPDQDIYREYRQGDKILDSIHFDGSSNSNLDTPFYDKKNELWLQIQEAKRTGKWVVLYNHWLYLVDAPANTP